MITIDLVSKEKLFPLFGYCHSDGRIEIREDLSKFEICSLLVHEFGHLDDKNDREGFYQKELESISISMFYPIIGTIIIAFRSLSPARLKFYYKRWREKK